MSIRQKNFYSKSSVDEPNVISPWEISRAQCIIKMLKKNHISGNVLEIGCADYYLGRIILEKFPDVQYYGVDINLESSELINENRLQTYTLLSDLPVGIKFDFIIMMDVLEHIENDSEYIKGIINLLNNKGKVIVTVPAFNHLFSRHDQCVGHYRRYNHQELKNLFKQTDVKIKEKFYTYFYISLYIGRLLTKKKFIKLSDWNYSIQNWHTKIATKILNFDFSMLKFFSALKIHLPGLSLLCIYEKCD